MALFSDVIDVFQDSAKANDSLGDKIKKLKPVLKEESKVLKDVTKDLKDSVGGMLDVIKADDFSDKSEGWSKASSKYDEALQAYYEHQVRKTGKFSDINNMSEDEKKKYDAAIAAERARVENIIKKDHPIVYGLGSVIKNNGAEAMTAIDEYMSVKELFDTPPKNLEELTTRIQTSVQTVISATQKMANVGQALFGTLVLNKDGDTPAKSVILNTMQNLGSTRFAASATALAAGGVGVSAMVNAFKTGDIKGAAKAGKDVLKTVKSGFSHKPGDAADVLDQQNAEINKENRFGRHMAYTEVSQEEKNEIANQKLEEQKAEEERRRQEEERKKKDKEAQESSEESASSSADDSADGGAEYVSEIILTLEGNSTGENSVCEIDGVRYLATSYTLTQQMLSPTTLSFSLVKKDDAEENNRDVSYQVCKNLIGASIEVDVTTRSSDTQAKGTTFHFKGVISGVNASRGAGGAPSLYVTCSTYDYLLDGTPNTRSFEKKTLADIVGEVTKGCSLLKSVINPRLKATIPYIVQYNQSDYEFLCSLAIRFGEWMYSDGTQLVFGEIVEPNGGSVVKVRYPSGNLFSHGVNLQLRDINAMHLSPNHYTYGKEGGIVVHKSEGTADRNLHELNECVCTRASKLYNTTGLYHMHTGGAFDSGEDEGTDEMVQNSIKVETRGKKAQMFTSSGASKVSSLFLGQKFEIEDGVENMIGDKKEQNQHVLMVLSVTHTFDANASYDNSFEAIPPTCDYPPYGNSDVYPRACQQRARVMDNCDPERLGRVRVQFPWQQVLDADNMMTPWIRIASPYSGFSKGVQFTPEKGEEVMVGFEMDNVERPYVIGTLFNGTGKPDEELNDNTGDGTINNYKVIRTRNGHTIQFCDNGELGDIQIYDYNRNRYMIILSSDEKLIRIEAQGNVEIVAGQDITMRAERNISIEAGQNLSVRSGKDSDYRADASMSISANDSMRREADSISEKATDSIIQESGNSHTIKTKVLKEKSGQKTSLDGGSLVEIMAAKVKIGK